MIRNILQSFIEIFFFQIPLLITDLAGLASRGWWLHINNNVRHVSQHRKILAVAGFLGKDVISWR
jgi:hypothetical protein